MFRRPMFRPLMFGPSNFKMVPSMIGAPRKFGHPIIIENEEIIPIRFHNKHNNYTNFTSLFNST